MGRTIKAKQIKQPKDKKKSSTLVTCLCLFLPWQGFLSGKKRAEPKKKEVKK
jgi:hypothetical protein